ncbi:hypothetical protein OESDEN_12979 [Oesophagostomum dentatum]|uniref:Uncharacterized protein n=1 Tax=Oesophagostomum dentatum TaxID=61180 RepID=A0A0B1SUP8_OESDE|nr:hypothetical protein OESDEN_12979 [Oesophagostomum dentatum]
MSHCATSIYAIIQERSAFKRIKRVEVCHLCKSRCPRHEELFVQEAEILLNNGVAYVIDSIIVRNSAVTQPSNSRRRNTNLFEIIR